MSGRDLFDALGGAEDWMLEHSERTAYGRDGEGAAGGRRPGFTWRKAAALLAAAGAILALAVTAGAAAGFDPAVWIMGILSARDLRISRAEVEEQIDKGQWIYLNGENVAAILPDAPVRILLSADGGETWRESTVESSGTIDAFGDEQDPAVYYGGWIGFFGDGGGYLVLTGGVAMGRQPMRVYLTADGGDTWRETGSPYAAGDHSCVLTGAGFSTAEIGFISYRYFEDEGPDIWWTRDGGDTWQELELSLPQGSFYTPLSPVFTGPDGAYPITAANEAGEETVTLYTHDYGLTWSPAPDTMAG